MATRKAAKAAKDAAGESAEPQKTEPKAAASDVGQAELQEKADAVKAQGFSGSTPAEATDKTAADAAGKD